MTDLETMRNDRALLQRERDLRIKRRFSRASTTAALARAIARLDADIAEAERTRADDRVRDEACEAAFRKCSELMRDADRISRVIAALEKESSQP